ncbi:MAG: right-handed parallel beta-helix repeat-containing protein [Elusimicrobia bacterium]|nr:right-handed parallel beta-helix repeat-containing protein [Elusimicrobiota bacterium]
MKAYLLSVARTHARNVFIASALLAAVPARAVVTCTAPNTYSVPGIYATISAAVAAITPKTLTGPVCVTISNNAAYAEQVTVQGFTNNGSSITIQAAAGNFPVVSPPAASTAAFMIANSSVNILDIDVVASQNIPYGVWASSAYVKISSVNVSTTGASGIYTAGIRISSWTSVSYSSVTVWNAHGLWLDSTAQKDVVSYSTFQAKSASFYALYVNGASSNTFTVVLASNTAGYGAYLNANAAYNTISRSTMAVSNSAYAALYIGASDSNTVTGSYVQNMEGYAALLSFADYNTVSQSTIVSNSSAQSLYLFGAVSNMVTGSLIQSQAGSGAYLGSGSNYNTISQSTMASNGSGAALFLTGSSSNSITRSYITNPAGTGAYLDANSKYNTISRSTMTSAAAGNFALHINGASSNIIAQSYMTNPAGYGVYLAANSKYNAISQSTMTSNAAFFHALYIIKAASNTIVDSYIQGSTAAFISGSTGTVIGGSVLIATNTAGAALALVGGSVNLTLSSSVLSSFMGTPGSKPLYLDKNNSGWLVFSTNTFAGGQFGVYLATQMAGTQVWLSSNTILVSTSATVATYGLYINGLITGATIQNNGISYRRVGAVSALGATAFYAKTTDGLVFDHNRIDNPGMITGGAFYGAYLSNSLDTTFRYNDMHSSGPALGTAIMLRLGETSSGLSLKNNVFFSSFTAPTVSSATVFVNDAASQTGFVADYNDYASSNSALGFFWTSGRQGLAAWRAAVAPDDAGSISADPRWYDVGAGVEDFHPLSAGGRWNTATQGFVLDGAGSATIDAADPAEDYSLESMPNGARANQGSYGNTAEASRYYPPPAPGGPADGARVSTGTPTMVWSGLAPFRVQLALDSDMIQVIADSTTANVFYVSTNSLTHGMTYWWKVLGSAGGWSSASSFLVDLASPTYTGPQMSTNPATGPWTALPSGVYSSSNVVSVQITVQDPVAGLLVSTGLPVGLVGQWHFDESSGTVALDASTDAAHGVLALNPSWVAGKRGSALSFNGAADQKVNIPYQAALNLKDNFTVESWVRPADAVANRTIITNFNGTTGGYLVTISGGNLQLWTGAYRVGPAVPADGQWHHVAVTQSGAQASFFVDGQLKKTVASAAALTSAMGTGIGGYPTFAYPFAGAIDELRLYNVVRSSIQILADYESDTFAAHNRGKAYNVLYSTNAGVSWTFVSTNSVTLTGDDGTQAAQTLTASDLSLVTSTGPGAPTNQVAFVASDLAGNVSTAVYVVLVDTRAYPGCVETRNVGAGMPYATISAGVAALPGTLTGHSCVVIRDGATYAEQVTVQNFTNNGSSISIFAAPGFKPVVSPPAASTAAFLIANSSVNILGIDVRASQNVPYGVWASSAYVQISSVNVSTSGSSGIYTAGIRISSWSAISRSSVTAWNAHGLWLDGSAMTAVSYSTFQAKSTSFYALYLNGASSNTFTVVLASNPAGTGAYLNAGADYNTISQSTMVSNVAGYYALYLNGSDSNTVTNSYIQNLAGHGAALLAGSGYNTISQSSMVSNGAGHLALYIGDSDSNTVTGSYISNPAGYGALLGSGADYNTISLSTMTSNSASFVAFYIAASDSNTVTGSYISNPAGTGAYLSGADYNTISQSTMVSNGTGYMALYLGASDGNTVTGSYIQNLAGHGALIYAGADYNTISRSTMTSGAAGYRALYIFNSASNTIVDSYIQGSTAAIVSGSTGTVIGGSVLVATNTAGAALAVADGSVNLTLSSSVLSAFMGTPGSTPLYLDKNNSGLLVFSTNTFTGGQYGVYLATQASGTQIWFSSNTILVSTSAAVATYGLYLNGLITGAAIQNNGIYYRRAGAVSALGATAFYAKTTDGLVFDHNRIDNPGMITGGAFYGAYLSNSLDTIFRYNDMHSSGPALGTAIMLRLGETSSGLKLKNNVFFSSFTAPTVSSATVFVNDAASQTGFVADYNDYASSNSALGFFWTSGRQGLAAWQAAVAPDDAGSISENPRWYDVGAGVEDFHPLSAGGRWNPATQGFVLDGAGSATIDAADPAEAYVLEPEPNGSRANQGSYGGTPEASKTSFMTMVGNALSWIWKTLAGGDAVRSGAPNGWQWRAYQPGSGRQIPARTAASSDWNWVSE